MAAYFTGGSAGTDVQAGGGADGLQTLYLMNPNYVGYTDAAAPAAANMMLFNSAVSSLTPASFGHHHQQPAQHFVGIPLQPPHSGYNLWAPATTTTTTACAAADMTSPRQESGGPGSTSAVSAVLSLSSREAPPVTVAAVPGTEARYMGASATTPSQQEQVVMSSRYLKAAQELLDEAVSVGKGVEEANAAKSATAVKKKEDSEGMSGGGAEDGGAAGKSGGTGEISTAERQEVQMKKSELLNMLDEVEQRYRQYHHQMQAVASSFEAAAGPGSARTYTALALRTISRQFRCLRDAIAAQVRLASRALGEEGFDVEGGGRNVGSRLRFIDHQLRQQRALQQLGMAQGGAWRPQRGLPERSVSVLRAWLFEHFLHPYPKDSDKVMLAKQTGLTRSQVSNWFINARVRLWKPMVEEMYQEEAKGAGKEGRPGAAAGGVGDDDGISCDGGRMGNNNDNNGVSMSSTSAGSMVDHVRAPASGLVGAPRRPGEQHSQASYYGGGGGGVGGDRNDSALFQDRLKKARTTAATTTDEPAPSFHHVSDVATLQAQAQATAAARRDEVSHRELLMKFMEAGGSGDSGHRQNDGNDGGYSLFTPAPYGQFGSEEQFAFAGSGGGGGGGVSLTLGLPHGTGATAEQTDSFLMSGSNGSDGAVTAGYDMNMQSTKSLAAQLMRDFVA